MNKNESYYRLLLGAGVFLTALSLTSTLILSQHHVAYAIAVVTSGMTVFGAWKLWVIKEKKADEQMPDKENIYKDAQLRSLASTLAFSYLRGLNDLSDNELYFVSVYMTLAILHTLNKYLVFNKTVCWDLIAQGSAEALMEMQKSSSEPLQLVWDMKPVPVEAILNEPGMLELLDNSVENVFTKMKICE